MILKKEMVQPIVKDTAVRIIHPAFLGAEMELWSEVVVIGHSKTPE
jgi:DNA-binding transcriptional regulator/RsmH inhibitor MraZ